MSVRLPLQLVASFVTCLSLLTPSASLADSTVPNSNSGWIGQYGLYIGSTNYATGDAGDYVGQVSDFFTFDLTGVSGTVSGASFNVYSYQIEGSGTYSIYTTSLTPSGVVEGGVPNYEALTSGAQIGSIALDASDSNEWLQIPLNNAGFSWLESNEGGSVVLGGAFPQDPGSGGTAFGGSTFNGDNALDIQTEGSATPEPSSLLLLGSGLAALGGLVRRKLKG